MQNADDLKEEPGKIDVLAKQFSRMSNMMSDLFSKHEEEIQDAIDLRDIFSNIVERYNDQLTKA